jgi:hypothetical protein
MARSGVSTLSNALLDMASIENSHIPQCSVIEFRQGGDGLLDLAIVTPLCPAACDGAPDDGQPTRADKSVLFDLARRKCEAIFRGWHLGSKHSSADDVFTPKHQYLGRRSRRNERNRFPSLAPGGLLMLPGTNLAGGRCDHRCRKSVEQSAI